MSGLLRRLANQTLNGDKSAVHSMARIPYAAPLELIHAENVSPEAEREATVGVTWQEGYRAPELNAQGAAPDELVMVRPLMTNDESIPAGPVQSSVAIPARRGDGKAVPPQTPVPDRPGRQDVHPAPAADRIQAEIGLGLAPEGLAPLHTDRTDPRIPMPPVSSDTTPFLPTRLVSAVETPAVRPSLGAIQGQVGFYQQGSDSEPQATEVHVHIGRIEVTAVHESSPPKRSERPVRKPMSLDEYLAKRQGRGK